MGDRWDGIPPNGADVPGWHWLALFTSPRFPFPVRWYSEEYCDAPTEWQWEWPDEFPDGVPEDVAKYCRYIAPCPLPEGYDP